MRTIFNMGDQLFIVCSEEDAPAITVFIGKEVELDWEKQDLPMVSRRILVTKPEINGKTLGSMHFRSMYGVNVTRVNRSGMDLFADPNLILQVGDRVMVVGQQDAVERVAGVLGNQLETSGHTEYRYYLRRYLLRYSFRKSSDCIPRYADSFEIRFGRWSVGGSYPDRTFRTQTSFGDLHHDECQPDAA